MPSFPGQHQPMPVWTDAMQSKPDHGEDTCRASGKLVGKKAIITRRMRSLRGSFACRTQRSGPCFPFSEA
jgi:hypothetical protein